MKLSCVEVVVLHRLAEGEVGMEASRNSGSRHGDFWVGKKSFGSVLTRVICRPLEPARARCSQKSLVEQPHRRPCRPLRREPAPVNPIRHNLPPETIPSHALPRSLSAQPPVVPRVARYPVPRRKKRVPKPTKSRPCCDRPRRRTEHTTPTHTHSIFLPKSALDSRDWLPGWIKKSNRPTAMALPMRLLRTAIPLLLLHHTRLLPLLHQVPRMPRPSRLLETSTSRPETTPRLLQSTQKVEPLDISFFFCLRAC